MRAAQLPSRHRAAWLRSLLLLSLAACGGGGGGDGAGGGGGGGGAGPPLPDPPARRASAASPVAAGCDGGNASGTLYRNAEVEPFAVGAPNAPNRLLAAWQQDRTSTGGALALVSAVSEDAGATWQRTLHPVSRCGGAAAGSTGDFERASDPWVDIAPDGTLHLLALSFNGGVLAPGSASAMLASRSTDNGRTWSAPAVLQRDGATLFNDKGALTADATDARYVYAVWDRLDASGAGPTLFARSVDGGASWQPARTIFTPGTRTAPAGQVSQTLGNRIVVLNAGPERGLLINVFTQIDSSGNQSTVRAGVLRSSDQGSTWSEPVYIAEMRGVGTRDPATNRTVRDGLLLPSIATGPDGSLWVAWQDARFSSGQRDAIALSRSVDGGRSWSAPLAVNRNLGVGAFTPTLHVRADGLVGLLHYDLRSDTPDAATFLADAWLISSRDGLNWTETRVAGLFDLGGAPDARGLFLGDYQGLASVGSAFLPVLVLSGSDTSNRTDVYSPRIDVAAVAATTVTGTHAGQAMQTATAATPGFEATRQQAVARALEARWPGHGARLAAALAARRAP